MKLNRGILLGISAYTIWGLLPIYWKALRHLPAAEILANRIIWSLVFVSILISLNSNWGWVKHAINTPRIIITFAASGILLGLNWFTYIWAVNAGFVIETSLGYFINPLLSVLLGLLFLNEKLRLAQVAALSLAAAGVLYLTFGYGSFPWIALLLAATFAVYGLLRKTAPLGSKEGLTLETAILLTPAAAYLFYLNQQGTLALGNQNVSTTLLLIGVGVITAVPLLLFGAAARRITLTNIGLLQYIAPTIQFLLGLYLFREPFSREQFIGFSFIWTALLIYMIESVWFRRRFPKTGLPSEVYATPPSSRNH